MTGITGTQVFLGPRASSGRGLPRPRPLIAGGAQLQLRVFVHLKERSRHWSGAPPAKTFELPVLVRALVVGLLLVARGLFLVLGLPLVVRHAVDDLAGLGVGDLDAARAGFLAVPARQAIAAETGQVHQVDILHIRALLQMRDQPAKSGGFEFGTGLV